MSKDKIGEILSTYVNEGLNLPKKVNLLRAAETWIDDLINRLKPSTSPQRPESVFYKLNDQIMMEFNGHSRKLYFCSICITSKLHNDFDMDWGDINNFVVKSFSKRFSNITATLESVSGALNPYNLGWDNITQWDGELNEGLNLPKANNVTYKSPYLFFEHKFLVVTNDQGWKYLVFKQPEVVNGSVFYRQVSKERLDNILIRLAHRMRVDSGRIYVELMDWMNERTDKAEPHPKQEIFTDKPNYDPYETLMGDLNETGLSDELGANNGPEVPIWKPNISRGHANPIDYSTKWELGTTRGPANSLFEGLNLPKKGKKHQIFNYLDNSITKVERLNEPNMGKNVFRLYVSEMNLSVMKVLVYPSGRVKILQHRVSFMADIVEKFEITRDEFDEYFDEWFKLRYGNEIISEGLKLPKKDRTPATNFSEWVEKYKPIKNHISPSATFYGYMFETYGLEIAFIRKQKNEFVWTCVEDDGGNGYILSGYHTVNRLGYFVTEVPWVSSKEDFQLLDEGLILQKKEKAARLPNEWIDSLVSDGTLNPEHLIPKYLSILQSYNWPSDIESKVQKLSNEYDELKDQDLDTEINRDTLVGIENDLDDLLNTVAPVGTYFGGTEGDGAAIGFWGIWDKICPNCDSTNVEITDRIEGTGHCNNCQQKVQFRSV